MRRHLASLIPALVLAMPMMAEEIVPPPAPPQPAVPSGAAPSAGGGKPELMKEMRELEGQWRTMKEKVDQDPDVLKLKNALDEAQKAYKAKAEEVMAKDPGFADLKARRDEMRVKLSGLRPNDGGQGKKKDRGDDKPPHEPTAAPTP